LRTAKEYTIERLNGYNLADVEKLHTAVYGTAPPHNYFSKKYNSSYAGLAYIGFIAYNKERAPIAYYGVIPCLVEYQNKVVLAAQSADTMTHPGFRYKGLFVELSNICFELCRESGINLIFGFPNQNSFHGAIHKLGWKMTETMDCFIIPVKAIPLERLFSRVGFTKWLYEKYKGLVLRSHLLAQPGVPNSVVQDGYGGVYRNKEYLEYKTYSPTFVIRVGASKAWIKIKDSLIIGDLEIKEYDFSELMESVRHLARKLGVTKIYFHICKKTTLHDLFIQHFQPCPSFAVLFQDFGSEIPIEKMKFTFADIDIF
jgi:hypothetical protein